ncbi:saccharopine dehydrogenase family protein [Paraglaciecola arctica]|uniref:saccharopine dehydrogenase family protein n=1 Tax=Paraglaciecola arctica TaxID=1128911 RepID=UPI001C075FA6|nr:saccharopine dehydrogenase NADP-binding domain-containing protein [Paraglaciecola arctica]MBU3003765.1 saccharopine dehydrogenase NADP-binding domain-containing protein [Paraglaciecola arctica]
MKKTPPKFDIVIFGATSFVGQILTRYMLAQFALDGEIKWAIAGRSQNKLMALKQSLGSAAESLDVLVADAADEASLNLLCSSTRVIISTVGPYALYGEPLLKTCVALGTDYCDLTGEVQWIAKMLERYESQAKVSGARIVNSCGFDSLPSDLGVYFLQQHAQQKFAERCSSIKMRVKKMKGAASGGTVASMTNIFKEVATNPSLRKLLANPYAICPADHGNKVRQNSMNRPQYDSDFNSWVAPFVMAVINTRIVHRSNALVAGGYSQHFEYNEAMLTGKGIVGGTMATTVGAGLGGFAMAAVLPPTRWAMEKFILPKPGEGPSQDAQEKGFYDLRFYGKTDSGQEIRVKVTGDQDPGYGSTAKMLAQAAACLAQDISKDCVPGGFWTPASIFGDRLIKRLENYSGLTFEVID